MTEEQIVLLVDAESASSMYEMVCSHDEDELVRPTFEMKAGDLKKELEKKCSKDVLE